MYAHGARFFVYGSNAVAVFSSYDHLVELLTKYKKSSINAAQLLEMMNDNQLFSQLAVMARLSNFVHNIWSMVTVKQSRRNLIDNIKHIKSQIEMIESETFSIDEGRFIRLSFGCLAALTIAKFNNLPQWLPAFDDEELVNAHDSERTNQSLSRDVHLIQKIICKPTQNKV